jgi:NADH dehydrogenase
MTDIANATPRRVVIVGAGFAGIHAARRLARLAGRQVEVTLINPTDYFLYLPLLPEVTAGVLDPRRVAVSLRTACPGTRLLLGTVDRVDLASRRVEFTNPEGSRETAGYDRLLLTAGSVSKLLPIPGVARHAHGFRSIAEALYLRDHLLRQLELAEASRHDRAACGAAGQPRGPQHHRVARPRDQARLPAP